MLHLLEKLFPTSRNTLPLKTRFIILFLAGLTIFFAILAGLYAAKLDQLQKQTQTSSLQYGTVAEILT